MSAAHLLRVSPTRIARPHSPELTVVRFDLDRQRRAFLLQLADIDAPELGPSERTYACLHALGVTRWKRGANGLRGCDDVFDASIDGEGTVRDVFVSVLADERITMRVELWDSLGWIHIEAAACRAYLRGSYLEPPDSLPDEEGPNATETSGAPAAPRAVEHAASSVVHRDLRTGDPFDPGNPFAELL